MNLVRRREASQVLAGFEHCRKHQTSDLTASTQVNEDEVRLGQRISGAEFLAGQPRTRARVGGAVDGCHKVSRKGSAVAAGWSVYFEGDRR